LEIGRMGRSRSRQKDESDLILPSHVASELLLLHALLIVDLALNSASITTIHDPAVATIVVLQCFLCLLHVVCISVCILETRYYKLGEWHMLRRFRVPYFLTLVYFIMLVVYFVELTQTNPESREHYRNTANVTYNQSWNNNIHSVFAVQKSAFILHAMGSRAAITHLSDPAAFAYKPSRPTAEAEGEEGHE